MAHQHTLIKKKIKFSSYIRKFRLEQLQSHIWGIEDWGGLPNIRGNAQKMPYIQHEEAVSHIWLCNCSTLNFPIMYMSRKIWFSFLSVYSRSTNPIGQAMEKEITNTRTRIHLSSYFFAPELYKSLIQLDKTHIFCTCSFVLKSLNQKIWKI